MRPTLPDAMRKAMSFSPSSSTLSGAPSDVTSSDRTAGIQYWRMRSPISVPGPMRHSVSLSAWLSMAAPPSQNAAERHVHPAAHLVRRSDGFGRPDVLGCHLADAGEPAQPHGRDELVLDDLEHSDDAFRASRRERPALQTPQSDHVRAERDGLEDVAAALDAAVEHDAGSALDGLNDLRQRVHAAHAVVDLPAAVVRDPDHVHAMLDGQGGVLGRLHALEQERAAPDLLDRVQRLPGHLALVAARGIGAALQAALVAAQQRALAPAVSRHVHRQCQRHVAGPLDARQQVFDPLQVAVHIELEDLGRLRRRGRLLQVRLGDGTDGMHDAKVGGGSGHLRGAVRVELLQPADGREDGRNAQLVAQERCRRVDVRHVHQDARPEGDPVERRPVSPQRRLRLGAAGQVVPAALAQPPSRLLDDLFGRDKVAHGAGDHTRTLSLMADQLVGQSIKRFEDDALVHGAGHYTDDFNPPGTLHLAIVRSPYPKARIVSINTEPAKAAPGVVDVITGEDVKDLGDIPIIPLPGVKAPRHPMLCQGYVAAPGAPVAAVLAETAAQAEDAAALVEAEYEPQPSVSEPEAAMAPDAPKVFDELENNVCYTVTRGSGDVDQAIAEADHVVRLRIDSPRLVALSLEPRATLAIPEGFGRGLTVYSSTQAPHGLRLALAQSLKYPENNIRVIAPDVGGGFGSKGGSYREDVLCGFLAMKHGRPVKYVATRSEDIMTTIQGRDMAVTAELAAKKDGTLTGFRINNIANMGAYLHSATALPPMFMLNMAPGCYKIPAASATAVGVFTNTTSTGPYRGAGRPEAVLAIERMVDEMAHELGMDAVELRRKNFIQPDEFPYKTAMGVTYDSGDYGKALDRALELAGYDQLLKERDERRAKGELVGIGLSTFVEPSGGLGFESGVVRMERSGRVTVVTGSSSHGQGHETVYAQIVADKLKVPIDHVKVLHGDTLGTPAGTGTFGSRSAMTGGAALVVASDRVVDKAKKVAAMMLEASPDDIELVDGGLAVAGTPDKKVPWQGVAMKAHLSPPPGEEPGLEERRVG